MKTIAMLLLIATCLSETAHAQFNCGTDEVHARMVRNNPGIKKYEQQLRNQLYDQMKQMNTGKLKTSAAGDTLYIPIVFHIIHDYQSSDYWSDNVIFTAVKEINDVFNGRNADTADIIHTYRGFIPGTNKRYIARSKIEFKLATKDPDGNPTHGITRRRSYLAGSAGDQAKFEQWPPDAYMNVWVVRAFGSGLSGVGGYALKPAAAEDMPLYDGVMVIPQNNNININNALSHELAHSLNLEHTWGSSPYPGVSCGDDDIDDTPPTKGHPPGGGGCAAVNLFDTKCIYTSGVVGKQGFNSIDYKADDLEHVGIDFKSLNKLQIDSVFFFPVDSGASYTIELKYNGASTGQSYTGVTANNKVNRIFAHANFDSTSAVGDNLTGIGIDFKAYDSIYIKDLSFYPSASTIGQPYEIVLKRNGVVESSFTGTVNSTIQVAPVGFGIHVADTNDIFSIQFASNPGVRRQLYSSYNKDLPGRIRITGDSYQNRYNYFHKWNIQTFDYKQRAPVNFLIPKNVDFYLYTIAFTDNPGAKRDFGPASAAERLVPNGINMIYDETNGYYNYFYDWHFRYGDYFQTYAPFAAEALFGPSDANYAAPQYIDYPDTVNSQNVMDVTYCTKMFTYLQAFAMRGTLASSVAGRNNLADPANVAATGALAPWPDLPPTADFSTNLSFVCPNQNVVFTNRSWNDTVIAAQWTFPNGAASANSTSLTTVTNNFSTPGWTSVKLKVTGNSGSGTGTIAKTDAIYVANPNAVDPTNYIQEFGPAGMAEYPMFNYYGNDHKWEQVSHAGYYDHTSIRYRNYDSRLFPATLTGTPLGDYDDFYTPAFDLTKLQAGNGSVYLNFYSSGAFRTNNIQNMGDLLEISYSTNCNVWINLKSLTDLDIGNNGLRLENFAPLGFWEWKPQSIELNPSLVSQDKVYFRFRFKPGVDTVSTNANQYMLGTGNNFYIDRLHLAKWTTAVSELEMSGMGITVAPNPTTGSSAVMIMDNTNNTAQIVVTDITGKVVFTTHEALNKGITNIEIPAGYITARGVYMVQVTTGTLKHTEKLVVY